MKSRFPQILECSLLRSIQLLFVNMNSFTRLWSKLTDLVETAWVFYMLHGSMQGNFFKNRNLSVYAWEMTEKVALVFVCKLWKSTFSVNHVIMKSVDFQSLQTKTKDSSQILRWTASFLNWRCFVFNEKFWQWITRPMTYDLNAFLVPTQRQKYILFFAWNIPRAWITVWVAGCRLWRNKVYNLCWQSGTSSGNFTYLLKLNTLIL